MHPNDESRATVGSDREVRLLCVGDLHVGRSPTRLPEQALDDSGIDRRDLAPAAAWTRAVELACERRVDAVVLLGDVLDEDNALLEAIGPFGQGVRRLVDAGIPVVAVAGNHDVEALPRLVDATPGLTLLGRGASWQSMVVRGRSGAAARLVGWSFDHRVHARSPLLDAPAGLRDGAWADGQQLPTVGLLHCDVDVAGSPHAPVRSSELASASVDAWLLGHIHRPSLETLEGQARPIGYLGSVAPLDPGESGWHGAWVAHCSDSGVRMERVALARHRYERVELDVGELAQASDVVPQLARTAQRAHDRIRHELGGERVVVGRLVLVGEHPELPAIEEELRRGGVLADSWIEVAGVLHVWEPRVHVHARQALDLDAIAAGRDVAAPLASLALQDRDGRVPLDEATRARLREQLRRTVLDTASFRDVPVELDDDRLDSLLGPALHVALDAIERHREGVEPAGAAGGAP